MSALASIPHLEFRVFIFQLFVYQTTTGQLLFPVTAWFWKSLT